MSVYRLPKLLSNLNNIRKYYLKKKLDDFKWHSVPVCADFNDLPVEIWMEIFTYLDFKSIIRMSQISRKFSYLALSNELWELRISFDWGIRNDEYTLISKPHAKLRARRLFSRLHLSEFPENYAYQAYKHRHLSLQRIFKRMNQSHSSDLSYFTAIQDEALIVFQHGLSAVVLPIRIAGLTSWPMQKLCKFRHRSNTSCPTTVRTIIVDLLKVSERFAMLETMQVFLLVNLIICCLWICEEIYCLITSIQLIIAIFGTVPLPPSQRLIETSWKTFWLLILVMDTNQDIVSSLNCNTAIYCFITNPIQYIKLTKTVVFCLAAIVEPGN